MQSDGTAPGPARTSPATTGSQRQARAAKDERSEKTGVKSGVRPENRPRQERRAARARAARSAQTGPAAARARQAAARRAARAGRAGRHKARGRPAGREATAGRTAGGGGRAKRAVRAARAPAPPMRRRGATGPKPERKSGTRQHDPKARPGRQPGKSRAERRDAGGPQPGQPKQRQMGSDGYESDNAQRRGRCRPAGRPWRHAKQGTRRGVPGAARAGSRATNGGMRSPARGNRGTERQRPSPKAGAADRQGAKGDRGAPTTRDARHARTDAAPKRQAGPRAHPGASTTRSGPRSRRRGHSQRRKGPASRAKPTAPRGTSGAGAGPQSRGPARRAHRPEPDRSGRHAPGKREPARQAESGAENNQAPAHRQADTGRAQGKPRQPGQRAQAAVPEGDAREPQVGRAGRLSRQAKRRPSGGARRRKAGAGPSRERASPDGRSRASGRRRSNRQAGAGTAPETEAARRAARAGNMSAAARRGQGRRSRTWRTARGPAGRSAAAAGGGRRRAETRARGGRRALASAARGPTTPKRKRLKARGTASAIQRRPARESGRGRRGRSGAAAAGHPGRTGERTPARWRQPARRGSRANAWPATGPDRKRRTPKPVPRSGGRRPGGCGGQRAQAWRRAKPQPKGIKRRTRGSEPRSTRRRGQPGSEGERREAPHGGQTARNKHRGPRRMGKRQARAAREGKQAKARRRQRQGGQGKSARGTQSADREGKRTRRAEGTLRPEGRPAQKRGKRQRSGTVQTTRSDPGGAARRRARRTRRKHGEEGGEEPAAGQQAGPKRTAQAVTPAGRAGRRGQGKTNPTPPTKHDPEHQGAAGAHGRRGREAAPAKTRESGGRSQDRTRNRGPAQGSRPHGRTEATAAAGRRRVLKQAGQPDRHRSRDPEGTRRRARIARTSTARAGTRRKASHTDRPRANRRGGRG